MGWTIRRDDVLYDVVDGPALRESRLLADGVEVDAATTGYWESSTLEHGATRIEVRWGPRNRIVACRVVEGTDAMPRHTPLHPPPGSRAARREAFSLAHPTLFVAGRVTGAGAGVVVGLLGLGALVGTLLGSLLPRIDLSWIPDVPRPDWVRYLDVGYWLQRLGLSWPDLPWPDLALPGWLQTVLGNREYWPPLVIALVVALGELRRRRQRAAERAAEDDGRPGDEP